MVAVPVRDAAQRCGVGDRDYSCPRIAQVCPHFCSAGAGCASPGAQGWRGVLVMDGLSLFMELLF